MLNEERMKYPKHKILSQSLIEILLPAVIRMTKIKKLKFLIPNTIILNF
jgi:hypothetical protein